MKFFLKTIGNIQYIWIDLIFKIAGNLFPLYLGALILFLFDFDSIHKIIDPLAFILYSSTFLFSGIYLWYKNFKKEDNLNLIILLTLFILGIVVSFFYAALFSDKLSPQIDLLKPSLFIFLITVLFYIFYECLHYEKLKNVNHKKENEKDYKKLYEDFDETT